MLKLMGKKIIAVFRWNILLNFTFSYNREPVKLLLKHLALEKGVQ